MIRKKIALLSCCLFLVFNSKLLADKYAGLIVSNIDTINLPKEMGFDFLTQTACLSQNSSLDCYHLWFSCWAEQTYNVMTLPTGFIFSVGKQNLDSIKTAPSDSIFNEHSHIGDVFLPDSLPSRIGMCYVIKTGFDPRDDIHYYVKIRILDFIVHNAETHEVDMIFLWAMQMYGTRDLATTGLDTFDIPTILAYYPESRLTPAQRNMPGRGNAFTARKLLFPQYGVVVKRGSGVFDLRGRGMNIILTRKKQHE